jgi:hypothetical protein
MSTDEQKSDAWFELRKCRLTASKMSAYAGRSHFSEDLNTRMLALRLVGLEKQVFSDKTLGYMKYGNDHEDYVRLAYSDQHLRHNIDVPGLAIWKEDPRFGGSLDGEWGSEHEHGWEIKCSQKMHYPLNQYIRAKKLQLNNLPPIPMATHDIFTTRNGFDRKLSLQLFNRLPSLCVTAFNKVCLCVLLCQDHEMIDLIRMQVNSSILDHVVQLLLSESYLLSHLMMIMNAKKNEINLVV